MVTDTVPVQLGPPAVVHGTASGLATVSAAPLPAAAAALLAFSQKKVSMKSLTTLNKDKIN